jgi:membrane protease YdiL (CAAX protease family)
MTDYDHLLAGGLFLLSAILALGKAPQQVDSAQRWAFYRQTWMTGVGMSALALLEWHAAGRPLQELGLGSWTGDRLVPTIGAAVIWGVGLAATVAKVAKGVGRERLRAIYAKYRALMPATPNELRGSWGAAVCAGTGEEIAFRGFLLWYAASLSNPIAALLVTSLLFGIAHGYLRASGVLFATAAGLLLGAALLVSGSLLLVIWMHATYNVASFTIGRIVLATGASRPVLSDASAT